MTAPIGEVPSPTRPIAIDIAAAVLLLAGALAVRTVSLGADPPLWLSWSAGIFTDEAMYAADARSVALFGHWAPGDFHGAIISPLLYALQLGAFRLFGPTIEAARMISVVMGLATVAFLWIAMDRSVGRRAAWIAATLLAFCPQFVFYNRLALMETPVACCLTASFACLATVWTGTDKRRNWLIAGGVCFAFAVAFKALAWLALPGFLIAARRGGKRDVGVFAGAVLAAYGLFWITAILPYAGTVARMNAYYLQHQYLPHSAMGLWHNVKRALLTGTEDGLLKSLWEGQGLVSYFALIGLVSSKFKKFHARYLILGWTLVPAVAFMVMSYTPSRYYVIIWPALICLIAFGCCQLAPKYAIACATFLVLGELFFLSIALPERGSQTAPTAASVTRNLDGVVVAGQFAPRLVFGTRAVSVYVQPGLANDNRPVERHGVTAIAVTRSKYWETWWKDRYPAIIRPDHILGTLRIGDKYDVDIYRVQ
jgi:4-amino-4-deoxy-L-arabinose transferase-like glycosyltransferase